MRALVVTLLLLAACDRNAGEGQSTAEATPVQLSFEGADYKDAAAKIAHGKRLAIILDCTGCHGSNFQGMDMEANDPADEATYAPNVTLLLATYSDAELDKVIRHGVPKDGREFWWMPVESYQFLSDADVAAIIAYLRTFKPAGKPLPPFEKNRGMQKEIAQGLLGNSQAQIAKYRDQPPPDLGPNHVWGRNLARVTCTQCHNNALQGWKDFTPDLDIAGAYSKAELERLLTTGEGKTKKKNFGMSEIVRDHLSHMTPRERGAIIDYVLARANRPQPAGAN